MPLDSHGHVVWLDQPGVSRALVGGKGTSLGWLASLGAPVPIALALATTAYAEFAAQHGLPRCVADLAADRLPHLRAQILTAPLPARVAASIAEGFQALAARLGPNVALAVRSSATVEDSPSLSFAGLHDTVLDVRTLPGLETAIRTCWASLWSERAVAYRMAGGIADETAEIAVVVQQLVRSDISFVVFTADPVSDRRDRLVISATWGLGEAVVSGLVVPDCISVLPDGQIDAYTVGSKHMMVIPGAQPDAGTREVPVPRSLRSIPVLSAERVASLSQMARDLARQLGHEADIEGGIAADTIYLFQARPITTLKNTAQHA